MMRGAKKRKERDPTDRIHHGTNS